MITKITLKVLMMLGVATVGYSAAEAVTVGFKHERHYSHAHLGASAIVGILVEKIMKVKWKRKDEDA